MAIALMFGPCALLYLQETECICTRRVARFPQYLALALATNTDPTNVTVVQVVPVSVPVTGLDMHALHPNGTAGEHVYDLHSVVYRHGSLAEGGVTESC